MKILKVTSRTPQSSLRLRLGLEEWGEQRDKQSKSNDKRTALICTNQTQPMLPLETIICEIQLKMFPFFDTNWPYEHRRIPGRPTLGARDFSSAVSGFCQVFIVTRARSFGLRPTPKIPAAREKNLWYPGYGRPFSPPESYFSGGEKRRPEMRLFASYDAKEFNKKKQSVIFTVGLSYEINNQRRSEVVRPSCH